MRERSLDAVKGLTALLMIFCHALLILGGSEGGAAKWFCEAVNLVAYPVFLFCFGRACALSYLSKPFREAAPRLLKTIMRLYCAYIISSFAALTLLGGEAISPALIADILLLSRLGPYSEFLIAFAIYALILLALLPAVKALLRSGPATGIACALLFALSLIPVSNVKDARLGLIIGMPRPACFPVMTYAPYILAGLLWEAKPDARRAIALCALLLTLASGGYVAYTRARPSRFPPSIVWLSLSAAVPPALSLIAARLRWSGRAPGWLCGVGATSLYYLIFSNIVFFAYSGSGLTALLSAAFAAITVISACFIKRLGSFGR